MLKKLYDRCVELARHKFSKPFLGFISFIESSFFPIPPDVMIIPMVVAKRNDYLIIASVATIFSALGALFGFYMLQNAIVIPSDTTLPRNLDQLLGNDGLDRPIHRSIVSQLATHPSYSIKLNVFGFRF